MTLFRLALEWCESMAETEVVARNLLLFVSALIPKALASLLTSAVIELSKPENVHSWYIVLDLPRGFTV